LVGDIFLDMIGKRVRVVQKDGFVKYGILAGYGPDFLKLQYKDNTLHVIATDKITSCDEQGLDWVKSD
jgi:hypothetical protein